MLRQMAATKIPSESLRPIDVLLAGRPPVRKTGFHSWRNIRKIRISDPGETQFRRRPASRPPRQIVFDLDDRVVGSGRIIRRPRPGDQVEHANR